MSRPMRNAKAPSSVTPDAPRGADNSPWTSLEKAKIVIAALIPLVGLTVPLYLNHQWDREKLDAQASLDQQKRADAKLVDERAELQGELALRRQRQEKLIEARLKLWNELSPKLNQIYSYVRYVGRWKYLSAVQVVKLKRDADEIYFGNEFFFRREFQDAYKGFMHECFRTFNGWRKDAQPRTTWYFRAPSDRELVTGEDNATAVEDSYVHLRDAAAKDLETNTVEFKPVDHAQILKPEESDLKVGPVGAPGAER